MKTDFSLKLLSLVILAGLILAFVNPGAPGSHPAQHTTQVSALP